MAQQNEQKSTDKDVIILVDSHPNAVNRGKKFKKAGYEFLFYTETEDCISYITHNMHKKRIVGIITSMMQRGGRREKGLKNGIEMMLYIDQKLVPSMQSAPLFGICSSSVNKQQCVEIGIPIIVKTSEWKHPWAQIEKQMMNGLEYLAQNKQKYEARIKALEEEIEKYKVTEVSLRFKIRTEEEKNKKLSDECKQCNMELIELKRELNELKRKCIDTTKYLDWSSDEFIEWICSLEQGRFSKYESKLREVFKEQNICGEAIPYIQKNEWQGWGIKDYMDRTNIDKHLKHLIKAKEQEKYNDEGNNDTPLI